MSFLLSATVRRDRASGCDILLRDRRGWDGRARAILLNRAGLHVVDIAGRQHEVWFFPRLVGALVVMDGDLPLADDLEAVAGDDDGGAFGESDAEEVRVLLNDGDEVVPAIARVDVLV